MTTFSGRDEFLMLANSSKASTTTIIEATSGGQILIGDGQFLLSAEFVQSGVDLLLVGSDGTVIQIVGYFALADRPIITTEEGVWLTPEFVDSFTHNLMPAQYAQSEPGSDVLTAVPVGQVETIEGNVRVLHADGTTELLEQDGPVFKGDVIETGDDATVNIVLADGTKIAMDPGARLAISEFIYEPEEGFGQLALNVVEGVFMFTSGGIAATSPDAMTITTPRALAGALSGETKLSR